MFDEQVFWQIFQLTNYQNNITDSNAKYNIFIRDLEHYVNIHVPPKKNNRRE